MSGTGHYREYTVQQSTQFLFLIQTIFIIIIFSIFLIFSIFFLLNSFGKGLSCQGNFVASVLSKSSRVADPEICCRQIVCPNIIVVLLASNSIHQTFLLESPRLVPVD